MNIHYRYSTSSIIRSSWDSISYKPKRISEKNELLLFSVGGLQFVLFLLKAM